MPGFFSYWIAMIATLAVICGSPGQAQTNKTPLPCGGPTGTQPTIHRLQTSGDCMTVFVFGKAANARKLVLFAHGDYEKKRTCCGDAITSGVKQKTPSADSLWVPQ